jgi:hypothetical protein
MKNRTSHPVFGAWPVMHAQRASGARRATSSLLIFDFCLLIFDLIRLEVSLG